MTNTLLAVAAVLGLSVSSAHAQSPRATVILPGYRGVVVMDTIGLAREIRAPKADVLAELGPTLEELKIPVQVSDGPGGYAGNLKLQVTRRLGDYQLSKLVECGVGMRGPYADSYRVYFGILATVESVAADRSRVKIAVAAGAQSYGGPLADPVSCTSTGVLEERFLSLIERRVATK